ncbi:hypothetical protein KC19_10G031600 [Ceratodon purpureus]|uniref:Uncharacterized protein n=1 Tax=Ceratodon purpureus TaxID=3225 RepID=A0A8T0GHH8_CERPU|nr:hypothetical protein KC19_10G031600 [Ceratodon purpureus]
MSNATFWSNTTTARRSAARLSTLVKSISHHCYPSNPTTMTTWMWEVAVTHSTRITTCREIQKGIVTTNQECEHPSLIRISQVYITYLSKSEPYIHMCGDTYVITRTSCKTVRDSLGPGG